MKIKFTDKGIIKKVGDLTLNEIREMCKGTHCKDCIFNGKVSPITGGTCILRTESWQYPLDIEDMEVVLEDEREV